MTLSPGAQRPLSDLLDDPQLISLGKALEPVLVRTKATHGTVVQIGPAVCKRARAKKSVGKTKRVGYEATVSDCEANFDLLVVLLGEGAARRVPSLHARSHDR